MGSRLTQKIREAITDFAERHDYRYIEVYLYIRQEEYIIL